MELLQLFHLAVCFKVIYTFKKCPDGIENVFNILQRNKKKIYIGKKLDFLRPKFVQLHCLRTRQY